MFHNGYTGTETSLLQRTSRMGEEPMPRQDFDTPWERQTYIFGEDEVVLQVDDTTNGLRWRIAVNGDESMWYTMYQSILVHRGYAVATPYFEPILQPWTPFKLQYAQRRLSQPWRAK